MNNLQDILLFPVRDAGSRKQFLLACLVALAGFIVPILPMLLLAGYSAKIMRQVIEERKSPSMPEWQGSDWSEMLMDGLRLYGAQLVLAIPLFIIMGFAFMFTFGGSMGLAISASENADALLPIWVLFFIIGIGLIMVLSILSIPYGVIISPVGPHVVTNRSFAAAFQFKDWWNILRKGLGHFILGYVIVMAVMFLFTFVLQFALVTIVLT
ncbi:MAG TPA: hypothetical protein DCX53_12590, partial [Anaerolineae bacterium]|nr:hypothetical protein [Anaerolineae bacterium]